MHWKAETMIPTQYASLPVNYIMHWMWHFVSKRFVVVPSGSVE